jgi:hypothetical protein
MAACVKQSESHEKRVPASMPAEVGPHRPASRWRTNTPVRVSRRIRVPEH